MRHSFKRKVVDVMLTGGRSARLLYDKTNFFKHLFAEAQSCNIYFTDERCVEPNHNDSNAAMLSASLCGNDAFNYSIYRMKGEAFELNDAAIKYSELLPNKLDFILLSMGEDGHIASLFPDSSALFDTERKVVPVIAPKAPFQRLTITPQVIKSAKQVYVLALGDEKKLKYEEALLDPDDISSIPARLVLDRTWIFDLDEEIDLCPKL